MKCARGAVEQDVVRILHGHHGSEATRREGDAEYGGPDLTTSAPYVLVSCECGEYDARCLFRVRIGGVRVGGCGTHVTSMFTDTKAKMMRFFGNILSLGLNTDCAT